MCAIACLQRLEISSIFSLTVNDRHSDPDHWYCALGIAVLCMTHSVFLDCTTCLNGTSGNLRNARPAIWMVVPFPLSRTNAVFRAGSLNPSVSFMQLTSTWVFPFRKLVSCVSTSLLPVTTSMFIPPALSWAAKLTHSACVRKYTTDFPHRSGSIR